MSFPPEPPLTREQFARLSKQMSADNPTDSNAEAQRRKDAEEAKGEAGCVCAHWARVRPTPLFTNHHPDCPRCKPLDEARAVIEAMLKGVENWASDEDGQVHPDAWEAYKRAKTMVYQFNWKEESNE